VNFTSMMAQSNHYRASAHWRRSTENERDSDLLVWSKMDNQKKNRERYIHRIKIEATREDKDQILLSSIRDGDVGKMEMWLDKWEHRGRRGPAGPNSRSPHTDNVGLPGTQSSALHEAVLANQPSMVLELLERGADVEVRDRDRYTPLILAATLGHDSIAEILLGHGADPDTLASHGRTALHKAALFDNADVASILVDCDPLLKQRLDDFGETPLDCAKFANSFGCVSVLSRAESRGKAGALGTRHHFQAGGMASVWSNPKDSPGATATKFTKANRWRSARMDMN